MTPREADRAIASGKPVTVRDAAGSMFVITLTGRDRRTVDGTYATDGQSHAGRFVRADLALVEVAL